MLLVRLAAHKRLTKHEGLKTRLAKSEPGNRRDVLEDRAVQVTLGIDGEFPGATQEGEPGLSRSVCSMNYDKSSTSFPRSLLLAGGLDVRSKGSIGGADSSLVLP